MNSDNFLIEKEHIETAQNISGSIEDSNLRSRATANILAAEISAKYFEGADIDVKSGIHNNASILRNLDISDIYLNDNYIDVRVYFDETELYIPKIHYDLEILPVAYMFVKLSEDLSSGNVTGFVLPEDAVTKEIVNGYYVIKEDDLKSFYDVESSLTSVTDEQYDSSFEKDVYDFLDGKQIDKKSFYQLLISSSSARNYFHDVSKAFYIFNFISTPHTINTENESAKDLIEPEIPAEENLLEGSDVTMLDESVGADMLEPLDIDTDVDSLAFNGDFPSDDLILGNEESTLLEEEPEPDSENIQAVTETETTDNFEPLIDDAEENTFNSEIQEYTPFKETLEEADTISEADSNEELSEQDYIAELEILDTDDNKNVALSEPDTQELTGEIQSEEENTESFVSVLPIEEENDDTVPSELAETDEFRELSKFDYSTEIEPSISSIEASEEDADTDEPETVTEEMLEAADNLNETMQAAQHQEATENNEQIETLFNNEPKVVNVSKKKISAIPILGIIVTAGALGWFGYSKYFAPLPDLQTPVKENSKTANTNLPVKKDDDKNTAMPIETVENADTSKQGEEAVSVNIPEIEQNLNASIEVSNLVVNWEVPLAYANNTTAKRYFVRIGKILQLNLKTELLLLSSPPITNKISIELEFNKNNNQFGINKIIDSSGVENVDRVIKDTVNNVLKMNMNMNMNIFSNLQGNPVLVIKL